MKKKATKKAKAAGSEKKPKKASKDEVKKELNPAQVLKDISALVEASANKLTEAVIGEGMKGQVSPVKYLFEMAHIFPQAAEGSETTTAHEESLAETLLDRLKIPKTPVVHDELQKEEDEDVMVIQPRHEAAEGDRGEQAEEKEELVAQ
ncbi:MAG TPA: hypothetical protein VMU05_14450 [Dongiaceae bacterium]|nr:hypothetical protein [Dongiaceae bacterium]